MKDPRKGKAERRARELIGLGLLQHAAVIADDGNSNALIERFVLQLAIACCTTRQPRGGYDVRS